MNRNMVRLLATAFLFCTSPIMASAQEKAPEKILNSAPRSEAALKEVLQRAKPLEIENVTLLSQLSGKWRYTAMVTSKDGLEPKPSTGTITNEMTLNDRFLSGNEVGTLYIDGHELLFTNQQFIGYDNAKKAFSSVSISTLSTGMMIGQGTFDKKENTLNATGNFTNPLTGAAEKFREVIEFTDLEHYKRTIFTTDKSGKETKLIEFLYSRGL